VVGDADVSSSYCGGVAWDFETDSEYQAKLDWAAAFVREKVEPLDYLFPHEQFVPLDGARRKIVDP
jgi:acyl-CoA dehydrogenase